MDGDAITKKLCMNGVAPYGDLNPSAKGDGICIDTNHNFKTSRFIVVRRCVSRGRGYAVIFVRERDFRGEKIAIKAAPRTSHLVRSGRFNSLPPAASIDDLPDTLLNKIFQYESDAKSLLKFGTVCRKWRRQIDISLESRRFTRQLFTKKLKIDFTLSNNGDQQASIETKSEKRLYGDIYDSVTVILKHGDENLHITQIDFLIRLAKILSPANCVLNGVRLTDSFLVNFFQRWRTRVAEMHFLRCDFNGLTKKGFNGFAVAERLKHITFDVCDFSTCPLAGPTFVKTFFQSLRLSRLVINLNACGDSGSIAVDDQLLDALSSRIKYQVDIRWLKFSNAPGVTTAGVQRFLDIYWKLRRGYFPEKRDFMNPPDLCIWLKNTNFDGDEFLQKRKKWFREEILPGSGKRCFYAQWDNRKPIIIWCEKTG